VSGGKEGHGRAYNAEMKSVRSDQKPVKSRKPGHRGAAHAGGLAQRLATIAGNLGMDATRRLTREQAHDRKFLRKEPRR
jgi:hypothetical protein